MSTSSVVRSRSPTNDSSASTNEKLAGMKTTKKAPTSESRFTTAVPPPNAASAWTPDPAPMGIASVSPTIARMRRSSLTASRRSRPATSAALRRSNFGQITLVFHNREVDVLQRRQLAHLLTHLQTGAAAKLDQVADRQRPAGGHASDVPSQVLCLVHAVPADDERAALPLQILEIDPRTPRAVRIQSRGRLVREHESRPVERGAYECHFLPHAFRECAQPSVAGVCELEDLEELVDPAPSNAGLDVVDRAEVVQVRPHGHALVQAWHLRHEANTRAHGRAVVGGVDAVDLHHSGGGQQHAGHAAQRGCLTCAGAAKGGQALALVDADRQGFERQDVAVTPVQ